MKRFCSLLRFLRLLRLTVKICRVGWKFFAEEMRSLPPVPDDIQACIDPVINGIDLLAEGKEWPKAAACSAAADAATARAAAARAAAAAAAAAYTAAAAAAYTAAYAYAAAYAAANAYAAADARLRQRDLLLRLISEAPITKEDS